MNERRRHSRVRPHDECGPRLRLLTGDLLTVIDIGRGGALVESRRQLRPGTVLVVSLTLRGVSKAIRALVIRCGVHALDGVDGIRYRGALAFLADTAELACEPGMRGVTHGHVGTQASARPRRRSA